MEKSIKLALLSVGAANLLLLMGELIASKTAPYNKTIYAFQKSPKYTMEEYIEEYASSNYVDELCQSDKTSEIIEEMFMLEQSIQIKELLNDLDLKEYEKFYQPLSEETINQISEFSYDEIVILKDSYKEQESNSYNGVKTKELLSQKLSYLFEQNEKFIANEGPRIVEEFGNILLKCSVAQALSDNPENYENYKISLESQSLDYHDHVLGNVVIELKKDCTFYKVWEKLNVLRKNPVKYSDIKETIELYKYAVISKPFYENGVVQDTNSWYTLHRDINKKFDK